MRIAAFIVGRGTAPHPSPRFVASRRRSWSRRAVLLAALVPIALGLALPQLRAQGDPLAPWRLRLEAIHRAVAERAHVGILVASLDRGDILYAINADRLFVPASSLKLFTTAAVLDRLGPEHRFETTVLALLRKVPGRRSGPGGEWDVTLKGGGDPVLTSQDLAELAAATRKAGITRVDRRLRCDDTWFDAQRLGYAWDWDDEPYPYAAQISALSVNGNATQVRIAPAARPGLPVRVAPEPFFPGSVDCFATTGPADIPDTLAVSRRRARNEIVVAGQMPLGAEPRTLPVTVEEPALFAGWTFRHELTRQGVRATPLPELRAAPPTARVIARHASPPLLEILLRFIKPSNNLIGEMLLKALGRERCGEGSTAAGLAEVEAFLREQGIDANSFCFKDGSSLSRLNLVSPRALVQLLQAMRRHRHARMFLDSLPVAAVDGTLRRRMASTAAASNLRGKTGTLTSVSALSGYLRCAGGEELVFSILTNNYPGPAADLKQMEDRLAVALAELRR
ncbi:MAG: D-alanyl-D-alanine carboxypeptidase/D-alanyl-D-alanine-endopeptidase [Armatimonadetes bacterium]|nr:D-alanyl-D-alanine carboxypeptidase/D-alanyl-D-alanine-endopeptidase [Armatimonadota bacterium]